MTYTYDEVIQFTAGVGRSLGYRVDLGVAHSNWESAKNEVEKCRK